MRKGFIATMALFLLAALGIGGALAWTGSTTGNSTATAGQISIAFYQYQQTGNKVVPTGNAIKVADGGITNNGDIAVHVTSGSVAYTGNPICQVTGTVDVTNGGTVSVGQSFGQLYNVNLIMAPGADDACQNYTLPYNVTINVAS